MRARRPNTDQEAEFSVCVDGVPLPEFLHPARSLHDVNIVECFVPVHPGQELTLHGRFNGSVLNAAFDVLADGAYVCDSRVEGANNEFTLKLQKNKKLEMWHVVDNPKPEGWPSGHAPVKLVEGRLHVKPIPKRLIETLAAYESLRAGSPTPGVGCLAVIVSLSQDSTSTYPHQYRSMTCGSWRERADVVRDSGIKPEYEADIRITDSNLTPKRTTRHKRHFAEPRCGDKPWAKFLFHYRSYKAIEGTGCIPNPAEDIHELEPCDPFKFTPAPVTAGPAGRSYTDTGSYLNPPTHHPPRETSAPTPMSPLPPPPPTEAPAPKPRLGGVLHLPKAVQHHSPATAPPVSMTKNSQAAAEENPLQSFSYLTDDPTIHREFAHGHRAQGVAQPVAPTTSSGIQALSLAGSVTGSEQTRDGTDAKSETSRLPAKRKIEDTTPTAAESPSKAARLSITERKLALEKSLAEKKAKTQALEDEKRRRQEEDRETMEEIQRLERENAEEDAKREELERELGQTGQGEDDDMGV